MNLAILTPDGPIVLGKTDTAAPPDTTPTDPLADNGGDKGNA
jgi:hypothetical protein